MYFSHTLIEILLFFSEKSVAFVSEKLCKVNRKKHGLWIGLPLKRQRQKMEGNSEFLSLYKI